MRKKEGCGEGKRLRQNVHHSCSSLMLSEDLKKDGDRKGILLEERAKKGNRLGWGGGEELVKGTKKLERAEA